jgi:hypothetical protein
MTEQPRFRRGPIETVTGKITVNVLVQQDSPDYWVAKVLGSSQIAYAGQTKKEAVSKALKGASLKPH